MKNSNIGIKVKNKERNTHLYDKSEISFGSLTPSAHNSCCVPAFPNISISAQSGSSLLVKINIIYVYIQ